MIRVALAVLALAVTVPAAHASKPASTGGGSTTDGSARAREFGRTWALIFNATARQHGWPQRVASIGCKEDGEAVFDCLLKIRFSDGRKPLCGAIAIDTQYRIWVNHRIPCRALDAQAPPLA